MNNINVGILISGNGSNLQAIVDAAAQNEIAINVALVVSNQAQAYGLQRAKKSGIEAHCIDHKQYDNRQAFEQALVDTLHRHQIKLVCLAGFMRLLSPFFLQQFSGKVINIHPSLLPAYPGLNAIEKAHKDQSTQTGVTVHWVDEGMDTGQIILQQALPIEPSESLEELTVRVHALEHQVYVQAIQQVINQGQLA